MNIGHSFSKNGGHKKVRGLVDFLSVMGLGKTLHVHLTSFYCENSKSNVDVSL